MQKIKTLILCLCTMIVMSSTTFAANKVNEIYIEALINDDGSMNVVQHWRGDFNEGTEVYIPFNAPSYLTVRDFSVYTHEGKFENIGNWDVDKSFEQKAYKNGIVKTSKGYELCFGISQFGNDNSYAIDYTLDNVIGGYSDYDGVNFRFVNDQMNTGPTDVTVEIRMANGTPITDEIADIWGFGYYGQVLFEDGAIFAYTESPIDFNSHLTVMFALNKGVISPSRTVDDSFETVKNKAFDGSDYDSYSDEPLTAFEVIVSVILSVGIFVVPAGIFYGIASGRKRKIKKFIKECNYFRDLPNEGNIYGSYKLANLFDMCSDTTVLSVGMLRLIDCGALQPASEEKTGFMGKVKENVSLKLMGENHGKMSEFDEYLYTVLQAAAGNDGILQKNELERYAQTNETALRRYISKCDEVGKDYLKRKNSFSEWYYPAKIKYLTDSGKKEFSELVGLKKYLEDFSLISERGVNELVIWKELLIYATLFGIADKVMEQMKKLYPQMLTELENYEYYVYTAYTSARYIERQLIAQQKTREQAQRSSGSGGISSFGGGGGSIGGGSGGGTR